MKYFDIRQKLADLKVFSVEDLYIVDPAFRLETLYEWEKKHWVVKLRSKKYIFADYNPTGYDLYLIGNKLYEPSYISLELTLNHYGVIPEAVMRVTSVTTNKTLNVETPVGIFDYKTLSPRLFFGYQLITSGSTTYKIASLEKAIIDYMYLNPQVVSAVDIEALRFNTELLKERLDVAMLEQIVSVFDIASLRERVSMLIKYLQI
jgi:predicted transcriptional regulator of viral defense system